MKKIIIISSVSVVCLALIGMAVAGGWDGWHPTPEEKVAFVKKRIAEKLDLTEEQKAALDRIAEDIVAEHGELAGQRQDFRNRVLETLSKERVDSQELKSLFDTKKPVIDNVMQMAAEHIADFHSILTPEQRETLIAEMENHNGHRCRFLGR